MAITIDQLSVHGSNGSAAAHEDLTAYAELTNNGDQAAQVDLTFAIDQQDVGTSHAEVPAGGSQWVQQALGQLAAGGHDLSVRGAVDDGMSSSEAHNGVSFSVAAPAAPTATLGALHIQPHTNVEHPAGQAWTDERVTVSVQLTNTGTAQLHAAVWISDEAGGGGNHDVTLAAGEAQWVQQEFAPLAVGTHTFTAQASTETDTQSVMLGHVQGTLTV